MPATSKAVAVAAGAAAALAYYLRRRRRAARMKLLATHTKIALLASERGAVVAMSPATSTVTFFKGSPRRVANKLRNKVAAIVEANPWLAARLDDDENGELALFVPPELPELFAERRDIAVERTPYASLVAALAPVLCGTSVECRGTAKPLFQVSLVSCANDTYALVVSANHSLVDGHGYYRIYNMLSEGSKVESLDPARKFDVPSRMVAAMHDEHSLLQRAPPGFLLRFITAQIKNAVAPSTHAHAFYINEAWVAARKATADGVAFLSTNDCVTSEFCSLLNCDVALMAVNFRGKIDGCGDDDVGNYEDLIAFTPRDYASPSLIRRSVSGPQYFRATGAPLPTNREHLAASYGAVTNWATFAEPLELDGVQQLHLPLLDWNASTPPSVFGAMVVFRPRAGRLAAFVGGGSTFVERVKASGMVGEAVL
ncbi:unnamed protein product [Pelagomonas calceolata]|uniref:Acyltransferase n=2 Tax=Pelagomonas calceolata TaxID=35677 RepID=A0A8J2STC5_9STRA|nr:unnamed protein product [Pelagomonas calceolata]